MGVRIRPCLRPWASVWGGALRRLQVQADAPLAGTAAFCGSRAGVPEPCPSASVQSGHAGRCLCGAAARLRWEPSREGRVSPEPRSDTCWGGDSVTDITERWPAQQTRLCREGLGGQPGLRPPGPPGVPGALGRQDRLSPLSEVQWWVQGAQRSTERSLTSVRGWGSCDPMPGTRHLGRAGAQPPGVSG